MEECGQLSNPGNDPLSVLIETIEKNSSYVGVRQSLLETGVNDLFVLLFKKPFQITFSRRSSVLGTVAVAEQAVGRTLKELTV